MQDLLLYFSSMPHTPVLVLLQGSYPGTLFRFPLRSDSTAATSNIKAQPTTPQQALQLLQSLTDVLPQALLFLKSLQEIEVFVVSDDQGAAVAPAAGPGPQQMAEFSELAGQPQLLFRASLKALDGGCRCLWLLSLSELKIGVHVPAGGDTCQWPAELNLPALNLPCHYFVSVRAGKDSLQSRISHFVSSGGGGSGAQQLDAFFRRLESTKESDLPCSMGKVQLSLSVTPALLGSSQPQQQQQQHGTGLMGAAGAEVMQLAAGTGCTEVLREDWVVCNQLGGGAARSMALDAWRQEKVKMIPWVGVAAHLATHLSTTSSGGGGGGGGGSGRSLSCSSSSGGRAFCFLPLPADTSLPVHINGYFELSSNRCGVAAGCSLVTSLATCKHTCAL